MANIVASQESPRRKEPDDGELIKMWAERWQFHDQAKNPYTKNWNLWYRNYKAEIEYEVDEDGKTTNIPKVINFPVERQHINSGLSEEFARAPQYDLVAVGKEDEMKEDVLKKVDDHLEYLDNFNYKLIKHGRKKKIFGVSIMFDGYQEVKENVTYFDVFGNKQTRLETRRKFISRVVDGRYFWCDNVDYFWNSEACEEDEYIPVEEVKRRYLGNPLYNQEIVKNVKGEFSVNKESRYYRDYSEDTGQKMVRVTHCYQVPDANGEGDRYDVLINMDVGANGSSGQVIRKGPNWHPLKWLPYSMQSDTPGETVWDGIGTCENVQQHKAAKVTAFDIYTKSGSYSTIPEMVVGSNADINIKKRRSGSVYKMTNGNISDFTHIQTPSPDASMLNVIQELDADASRTTAYDPNGLAQANPSEAATKVLAREEAKRKNVALYDREFDIFFKRMKQLRIANIQAFYPQPLYDALAEDDPEYEKMLAKGEFEFPKLMIKGKIKKTFVNSKGKKTDGKGKDDTLAGVKIEEGDESHELEITPALIRGNFDIKVRSGENRPVLKALELSQLLEVAGMMTQLATQGEALKAAGFPLESFTNKVNELTDFDIEKEEPKKTDIDSAEESIKQNQLDDNILIPNTDAEINAKATIDQQTSPSGAVTQGAGAEGAGTPPVLQEQGGAGIPRL